MMDLEQRALEPYMVALNSAPAVESEFTAPEVESQTSAPEEE